MAFYQLEPWGSPVEDDRFRVLTTYVMADKIKPGVEFPVLFDRDPAPVEVDEEADVAAFFGARV